MDKWLHFSDLALTSSCVTWGRKYLHLSVVGMMKMRLWWIWKGFLKDCIYLWLQGVFVAPWGLSLVEMNRGLLFIAVCRCSLQWLLLLWNIGFRTCEIQQLWHMALIALLHVGSSWSKDRTYISCISRRILNHWTTREVHEKALVEYTFLLRRRKMTWISIQCW